MTASLKILSSLMILIAMTRTDKSFIIVRKLGNQTAYGSRAQHSTAGWGDLQTSDHSIRSSNSSSNCRVGRSIRDVQFSCDQLVRQ